MGLLLLAGCSGAPEATDSATEDAPAAETTEAITGNMTWSQGEGPKTIMATSQGFCFLTGISGGFRGGGESVSVDPIGGNWVLSGSSGQGGVSETVTCVQWRELGAPSGQVLWASPNWQTSQFIGNQDASSYCFMTGFKGETNGGGEGVSVFPSSTGYQLTASHLSGSGMYGKMACVRLGGGAQFKLGNTTHIAQKFTDLCKNVTTCYNSAPLISTGGKPMYCMLTQLAGKMRGGGESASVVFNSNTNWTLNANSMQGSADGGSALNTTARCNFY